MSIATRLFAVTLLATSIFLSLDSHAEGAGEAFTMSVTEPTIVGDTVLNPGTYSWKLVDSASNRNIVQITNKETGRVAATIFAISDYRMVPSDAHEVDLWETPKGLPRAIHTWFPPGENYGQEFAYPTKLLAGFKLQVPTQVATAGQVAVATAPRTAAHRVFAINSRLFPHFPEHSSRQQPQGSWAVITNGVTPKSANQQTGFWAWIKNKPLAATVPPLIGLAALISLIFYLLTTHSTPTNGART